MSNVTPQIPIPLLELTTSMSGNKIWPPPHMTLSEPSTSAPEAPDSARASAQLDPEHPPRESPVPPLASAAAPTGRPCEAHASSDATKARPSNVGAPSIITTPPPNKEVATRITGPTPVRVPCRTATWLARLRALPSSHPPVGEPRSATAHVSRACPPRARPCALARAPHPHAVSIAPS